MISQSWAELDAKNQKTYNNAPRRPRPSELVEVYGKENFSNSWKRIRLYGPIKVDANHIVKGKIKKKDRTVKDVFFYVPCLNYNRETGEKEDHDCPYCKYVNNMQIRYYQNAIIRDLEENVPSDIGERTDKEKQLTTIDGFKCYVKESKESSAWTPVRIIEIPTSVATKLKGIQELNRYKDENGEVQTASPSDLKYGVDLLIKYDDKAAAQQKYDVQRDPDSGKTPITNEIRKHYLMWDLEIPQVDAEAVKKEFPKNAKIVIPDDYHKEKLQEYLEELEKEEKSKKESKPKTEVKSVTLDDDDLDDISPAQEAMSDDTDDVRFESKAKPSSNDYDDEFEDL